MIQKMFLLLKMKLKEKIMKLFRLNPKKEERVPIKCVLTSAINITSSKELF